MAIKVDASVFSQREQESVEVGQGVQHIPVFPQIHENILYDVFGIFDGYNIFACEPYQFRKIYQIYFRKGMFLCP